MGASSPISNANGLGKPPGGPYIVNQVFTVATGWGYAARCGCGWKTAHETKIAALVAGQRHLRADHDLGHDLKEEDGAVPAKQSAGTCFPS